MQIKAGNPDTIVAPASCYAQAVLVTDASRWLTISGQIGVDPEGNLEEGTPRQIRRCFENIIAVLTANDMAVTNLVKLTIFITEAAATPEVRRIRDEMLAGHLCASTLLVVSALAHPDFTVEIEATAAA